MCFTLRMKVHNPGKHSGIQLQSTSDSSPCEGYHCGQVNDQSKHSPF